MGGRLFTTGALADRSNPTKVDAGCTNGAFAQIDPTTRPNHSPSIVFDHQISLVTAIKSAMVHEMGFAVQSKWHI